MAARKSIKKAVCSVCNVNTSAHNIGRKHSGGECNGTFVATIDPKEAIYRRVYVQSGR